MAIEWPRIPEGSNTMKTRSEKTWHLTADRTRAVPENHADGALLLVAAGCEIEAAELEKYNLLPDGSGYQLEVTAGNGSVLPDDAPTADATAEVELSETAEVAEAERELVPFDDVDDLDAVPTAKLNKPAAKGKRK